MCNPSLLVALLAASLLGACSREKPAAPVPEAMASTAEPAPVDEKTSTPTGAPLVFRVMREGGGGIDATINQIDPHGQASYYATVPGSGEIGPRRGWVHRTSAS